MRTSEKAMLHAPVNDRKTKAEASSKTVGSLPVQERFSQLPDWTARSRQAHSRQHQKNLAVLQKSCGNQAVLRMQQAGRERSPAIISPFSQRGLLQRKCTCGNSAGASETCAECQKKDEESLLKGIQTKLMISQPGDEYEQEADRIADQVMRMPKPFVQSVAEMKDKKILQTKAIASNKADTAEMSSVEETVMRIPDQGGVPLPQEVRSYFEPRFGYDFSQVRVHTDENATTAARAVHAHAYTLGRDIVFNVGEYTPQTHKGKQLLAHELTHVVQQGGSAIEHKNQSSLLQRQFDDEPQTQEASLPADNESQTQNITFENCNDEFLRCNVIEPMVHAKQMVDAVLSALPPIATGAVTKGRIIDLLNVHFHTASPTNAATILDNFRSLRTELDGSIRYICHPNENPPDCESTPTGFVGAFTTCAAGADVHLCDPYHVSLLCEQQARVLVHEAAHHIPGICNDFAYVGQSDYMTLPPEQAMGNADTYAQFAKMVFLGTPNCIDCGTEIQRSSRKRQY